MRGGLGGGGEVLLNVEGASDLTRSGRGSWMMEQEHALWLLDMLLVLSIPLEWFTLCAWRSQRTAMLSGRESRRSLASSSGTTLR